MAQTSCNGVNNILVYSSEMTHGTDCWGQTLALHMSIHCGKYLLNAGVVQHSTKREKTEKLCLVPFLFLFKTDGTQEVLLKPEAYALWTVVEE